MYPSKLQQKSKRKLLFIIVGGVLALLLLLFVLERTNVINLYTNGAPNATTPGPDDAKTTSTAPTAQSNFAGGDDKQVAKPDRNEGNVQDTGGNVSSVPPQEQWTSSTDGAITVYSPSKNSVITSGGILSGASNLSKVSFRLIDDVSGVIATGTLNVVNGKFSGKFNFSTEGTNGRLDIFSAAPDGVESSNIEIPVRFR